LYDEHPVVQKRDKVNKNDRFIKELGEDIANEEPDWVHDI
jgi:hypothetical protein